MAITIEEFPYGGGAYRAALALRHRILREPLGLHFTPEEFAADEASSHFGAFEEGRAIGSLMLMRQPDGTVKLRQMAVDHACQGRGLGSRLMAVAEQALRRASVDLVFCHARSSAIGFYARHGLACRGEPFIEVTLPHVRMEKVLSR